MPCTVDPAEGRLPTYWQ